MTHKIRSLIGPVALAVLLPFAAGTSWAACMTPADSSGVHVAAATAHAPLGWSTSSAGVRPEGASAIHDIAGFWKFTFMDPQGATTDFGYVGMHEGGTETIISVGRPPVTGDACMGVWERRGPNRYKVSHYAPLYAPDNLTFLGTVNIVEELKLAPDGESFTGTLATTGYDTSGNILFQAPGLVSATRVRVDTPAP